jgi:SAM-dependent methyltransferase
MTANTPEELEKIYNRRFSDTAAYRNRVWKILCKKFFYKYIPDNANVLDLGCGYGEFINNISAKSKHGMDLNPASQQYLAAEIHFHKQDCSIEWRIEPNSLDCVFTSNFFEHLPNKKCLSDTLNEAFKALKPGGRLIAMGPNIKFLTGQYWDFYDHHVILTETSLAEALEIAGFKVEENYAKFLPYTLVNKKPVADFLIKLYLKLKWLWSIKGKQFLVIACKPNI